MKKLLLILVLLVSFQSVSAQFLSGEKEVDKFEGFFDFRYQKSTGKVWLVIEDLDREFLYVNALSQGLGSNDIGLDRGQLNKGVVVKFIRSGEKLLLIQPNQTFRAITENEKEKQSIEEAFAKSVLYGFKIQETQGSSYLIEITDFLVRDAHGVAQRLKSKGQGSYKMDASRSGLNLNRTRAFPKNVEFDAILTFTGHPEGAEIKSVAPDASSITAFQHHSFVELPDDKYKPRVYDPRSGSNALDFMDYATPVNEPIGKKWIYRHRLEKKDPTAAQSEAIEPIIYYLDPGTPEPVRSALLEGASWWNQAFETAGFIDAFQVRMLPEDADPLDLRYNVIQWVHRSTRGWSYGMSIRDPRTGEIIKGHVSLGSLRIRQDFMIAQALKAPYKSGEESDDFALEMALARIRQLSAHEVGHTLGFSHNFAASTVNRSSVMDYPHPWIKAKGGELDFSEAYAVGIGDWDKVAVTYAYGEFSGDEETELRNLLDQAFEQGHRYVTDADARPAGSSNVYAHLWDNGNDIVEELENVMKVREIGISNFSADNIRIDEPYSVLEDVFVPLYFYHRYQTEAVSKLIAGKEYGYRVRNGKQGPAKVLDSKEQERALEALMTTIDAEQLAIPKDKQNLFLPRTFGYPRSRESFKSKLGVDFDPFSAASTASRMTLSFILHPERASRLMAQKAMDKDQLGLEDVLEKLIDNTFSKEHKDPYLSEIQNHINEQLLETMYDLVASKSSYKGARALVADRLRSLSDELFSKDGSSAQKAINRYNSQEIIRFLKNPGEWEVKKAPRIPDGSPIGTYLGL
ncbi:MAG: zinc-dependent metalloprotease [Lutimonas sp.]